MLSAILNILFLLTHLFQCKTHASEPAETIQSKEHCGDTDSFYLPKYDICARGFLSVPQIITKDKVNLGRKY